MKATSLSSSRQNGFSLFEVLMFIAVIGVLTGILVPLLSPNSEYESARNRRNAQELSMVYTAAQIAGLNLEGPDLVTTIQNVIKGGSPSAGVFKDHNFGVHSLAKEDIAGAANYLKLNAGQLIYLGENSVASADNTKLNNGPRTAPRRDIPIQSPATLNAPETSLAPKVVWTLQDTSPSQAAGTRKRASL